jgi:ferredoxin
MIVSRQKPLTEITKALAGFHRLFLVGCAKCATVCKSGGEEEVFRLQECLTAAGHEVTGSVIIDETCHILRSQRELRGKREMVAEANAILVLACGAGVQAVASAGPKPTIAGTDTLFLGNIRRFGQFEERCSLCGSCLLNVTGGICPVTLCAKGILNGPCGGMDDGQCEVDRQRECAWCLIHKRLQELGNETLIEASLPPRLDGAPSQPASLVIDDRRRCDDCS